MSVKAKKPRLTRQELWKEIRKHRMIYLLICPFFLIYAVFGLYPICYALYLSFHKWNGNGIPEFVGALNYQYLLKDSLFIQSIVNTLIIWVISTIPMVLLALVIAFVLNTGFIKGKTFFRAVYFLPNVTSTVAVALIFSVLFANRYGLINYFLSLVGMDPIPWLSSQLGIQFTVAMVVLWRWTGYNAVICLAGLQKISPTLYEAAKIDGANTFQIFTRITIPQLNPTIIFVVITSTIGGWQLMEESYMLVGKAGGTGKAGMTVVLYLYNKAFVERQFGYGSAVAWGLFLIILAFSLINWLLVRRDTE